MEALRDVLFDPRLSSGCLSNEDIKQIAKRNRSSIWRNHNYLWTLNSVGTSIQYGLWPPSAEKVISKAQDLVNILINENLRPISFQETEEITRDDIHNF